MASSRHNLGRKPWHNPRGLLPRRASSSRPPGRGQGADCLAFAPGCENSVLSDRPRDHVGSDKWARAGRCRGHPCDPKQGAGGILRRGPGAVPHRVRARLMARALAATAWRGTPCPRSRMGAQARNLSAARSKHHQRARIRRGMERHRGSKPAVCSAIAETGRIAGTDSNRASFARRLRKGGSGARQHVQTKSGISIRARRRCRSIPFVR